MIYEGASQHNPSVNEGLALTLFRTKRKVTGVLAGFPQALPCRGEPKPLPRGREGTPTSMFWPWGQASSLLNSEKEEVKLYTAGFLRLPSARAAGENVSHWSKLLP